MRAAFSFGALQNVPRRSLEVSCLRRGDFVSRDGCSFFVNRARVRIRFFIRVFSDWTNGSIQRIRSSFGRISSPSWQ
jgi:hypothetical protein